jgi:hypothetical protein
MAIRTGLRCRGSDASHMECANGLASQRSAAASAPLSAINQSMSGYAFEAQRMQLVAYVGQNLHIHELCWAPD